MDQLFRKFGQKYKKAKEELDKWNNLQLQFLGLFCNAITILERLPCHCRTPLLLKVILPISFAGVQCHCRTPLLLKMLMDVTNFGALKEVEGMVNDLPAKQLEALESLFVALHKTLNDFARIKDAFKRLWRESSQLLKAGKLKSTSNQAQQQFGLGPNLNECIEGLENLFVMHRDEYQLKVASVNAISYNPSPVDMVAMQSILADQPSVPPNEVKFIFDFFNAGNST